MGLFSRRPQPVAPPPEPVLAGDPQIARRVVRAHLLVVGNDPQLRYTAPQFVAGRRWTGRPAPRRKPARQPLESSPREELAPGFTPLEGHVHV
jgi:hypothetical protein